MFPTNLGKKVRIIAELSNQHNGDMGVLGRMILQAKIHGADFVKVQLFSSVSLFGDERKQHLEISEEEFHRLMAFSKHYGIEMFASVFDEERLEWCLNEKVNYLKVASRTYGTRLCEKILMKGLPTFVSNGNHGDFRYYSEFPNSFYFYCIPEYPTMLCDAKIPSFIQSTISNYIGYSDHCLGLTAAKVAVVKGARYIEKHFTTSTNLQSFGQQGHLGAMDSEGLADLRRFCDEFSQMPS